MPIVRPLLKTEVIESPPAIALWSPVRRWSALRDTVRGWWGRLDHDGLRYVSVLFIATRLLLVLATVVAAHLTVSHDVFVRPTADPFWRTWFYWDSTYYADIATYGYTLARADVFPAFFPLYPILEWFVGLFVGGDHYLAGLLITNAAWFVTLYELYVLARSDFDVRVARGAVLALSVFPTAFFGFVAYPESLFLALAVGSFLCMRRGQWWSAALLGCFAGFTRQAGALLVLPFLWEFAVQQGFVARARNWRVLVRPEIVAVTLIPLGVVLFAGWLWHIVGDPLAFIHVQRHWLRVSGTPWGTIIAGFTTATQPHISYWILRAWQELAIVLLMGGLLVAAWSRLPRSYSILATTLYLLFLSQPEQHFPLLSQSRFALELFPLFIVLGDFATRRRWSTVVLVAVALPLQLIFIGIFSHAGWII